VTDREPLGLESLWIESRDGASRLRPREHREEEKEELGMCGGREWYT
jgi:hypothetical protein